MTRCNGAWRRCWRSARRRDLSAGAHTEASDASALSALPIAVSVAAPAMLLSAGAVLTVVAVAGLGRRHGVGARARLRRCPRQRCTFARQAAGGLSVAAGTAVVVTAVSAGWVLSAAGQAIAFIPNEIGAALLYNERVTR